MEERVKSDSDITEKKIKKQSQKDMDGVIGCLVLGIISAFFPIKYILI